MGNCWSVGGSSREGVCCPCPPLRIRLKPKLYRCSPQNAVQLQNEATPDETVDEYWPHGISLLSRGKIKYYRPSDLAQEELQDLISVSGQSGASTAAPNSGDSSKKKCFFPRLPLRLATKRSSGQPYQSRRNLGDRSESAEPLVEMGYPLLNARALAARALQHNAFPSFYLGAAVATSKSSEWTNTRFSTPPSSLDLEWEHEGLIAPSGEEPGEPMEDEDEMSVDGNTVDSASVVAQSRSSSACNSLEWDTDGDNFPGGGGESRTGERKLPAPRSSRSRDCLLHSNLLAGDDAEDVWPTVMDACGNRKGPVLPTISSSVVNRARVIQLSRKTSTTNYRQCPPSPTNANNLDEETDQLLEDIEVMTRRTLAETGHSLADWEA